MTADTGYIKAWFDGPKDMMDSFRSMAETADRQNQFYFGLSWLDDLDCDDQVESESVSYDSISATQEFLTELLKLFPRLQFEGRLEHSWPTLPFKQTIVVFFAADGKLHWEERCEELTPDFDLFAEDDFEEDGDEITIPLTPYD